MAQKFNPADYNVNSFSANYSGKDMTTRSYQEWCVKLTRKSLDDSTKVLLLDVDPTGTTRNSHLRFSSDEDWMIFPLVVQGPFV